MTLPVAFNYEIKNNAPFDSLKDNLSQALNGKHIDTSGFVEDITDNNGNPAIRVWLTEEPFSNFPIHIYNGNIELDVENLSEDKMEMIIDLLTRAGIYNFSVRGYQPTADGIAPKGGNKNNVDWDKRRLFASHLYWRNVAEEKGKLGATFLRVTGHEHSDKATAKFKEEKFIEASVKRLLLAGYPEGNYKRKTFRDGWTVFTCYSNPNDMKKDGEVELNVNKRSLWDLLENPPEAKFTHKVRVGVRRTGNSLQFFIDTPPGSGFDVKMFKQMLATLQANGYNYIRLPDFVLTQSGDVWKACGARLIVPRGVGWGRDEATTMMKEALNQPKSDKEKRDFLGRLVKELEKKNPTDSETLLTIQEIKTKMTELVSEKGMSKTEVELIRPKLVTLTVQMDKTLKHLTDGNPKVTEKIAMHRLYNEMMNEVYASLDNPTTAEKIEINGQQLNYVEALKTFGWKAVVETLFTKEKLQQETEKVKEEILNQYKERLDDNDYTEGGDEYKRQQDRDLKEIIDTLRETEKSNNISMCDCLKDDFGIELRPVHLTETIPLRVKEVESWRSAGTARSNNGMTANNLRQGRPMN